MNDDSLIKENSLTQYVASYTSHNKRRIIAIRARANIWQTLLIVIDYCRLSEQWYLTRHRLDEKE